MFLVPILAPNSNLEHKDMINFRNYFFRKRETLFSSILILEIGAFSQTIPLWQFFFRLNETFGAKVLYQTLNNKAFLSHEK